MRTKLSIATLALLALPFLVAATPPPEKPAPKPASPGARREVATRRALEAVTERYRALKGYHLEGRGESRLTSSQGESENVSWVCFSVRRPDRYASEVRTSEMTTHMVLDGDSLWTALPGMGQYQVQPFSLLRDAMDSTALARQFARGLVGRIAHHFGDAARYRTRFGGVVAQAEHDQRVAEAGEAEADAAFVRGFFLLLLQRPGGDVEHVVEHADRRRHDLAETVEVEIGVIPEWIANKFR